MKPQLGGRRTPGSVSGRLVYLSAALKRDTDIVHHFMTHFSRAHHPVTSLLSANLRNIFGKLVFQ